MPVPRAMIMVLISSEESILPKRAFSTVGASPRGAVGVVRADAGAEGDDHGLDLVRGEHLVEAGLLDVEDLPLEREDGLEAPVAPLLGRAARGISLDQEQLRQLRIALGAVGELAGQVHAVEGTLAPGPVAGWEGGVWGR